MADPKKHHFVPQFLLENFIIPNSNPQSIWIHNLKYLGQRKGSPASTAYSEHLYSLIKEKSIDVYWENQFQKLETEAAPIVAKIIKDRGGQNLTFDEKTKFARFVGYSFVRTPQFIKQIENMMIRLSDAVKKAVSGDTSSIESIALESKKDPVEYLKQALEDPSKFDIPETDKKRFVMGFMNDFGRNIATVIRNDVSWFFVESTEKKYCIADDPVIFYSRKDGAGWRHGIGHEDLEIYFPLSPNLCFESFKDLRKFPDLSVEQINELSIWQAHERVFSSGYDFDFTEELKRRSTIENIVPRDDFLALYVEKSGGFTSGDVLGF